MKALNFSLERFMACLYPDHQWNEWLFKQARVPGGYWKSHEIQRRYYQWISKELQIKNLADWYRIKPAMVQGRAGLSSNLNPIFSCPDTILTLQGTLCYMSTSTDHFHFI
jgi:hypothetical protein